MPIRIKCPSCQTILGVKEALAGKKANCPKCRFVLTIPRLKAAAAPAAPPAAPPPVDADALAASAFADEPAPVAKPVSTQTISFECPFCAETVKVSAELSGKQTPCTNPECKRIIKVPLLKEEKPKDWRQASPRGPTGALRKNENEPEGAWSTAQKTRVSTEALLEADAIPAKKEPVTLRTWLRRGALVVTGLVLLIAAVVGFAAWRANSRLYGPLTSALAAVDRAKPNPVQTAAVYQGAGEFYVGVRDAGKAREYFGKARGLLITLDKKHAVDLERDAVLTALALAMVDLGGNDNEVLDKHRVEWDEMQKELASTLSLLSCDESKQMAMREVGRKLAARDQPGVALFLSNQLATSAEPPAPEEGEDKKASPALKMVRLKAQQIGLLLALKDAKTAKEVLAVPDVKKGLTDPIARLAYAEGWAREGKFEEARTLALAKGSDAPLDRLEASLAVALVAVMDKKSNEAKTNLQDALQIFNSKEFKDERNKRPGLLQEIARVAARVDMEGELKVAAGHMPDKASRNMALLELVTAQLEAASEPVAPDLADKAAIDNDTLAYALAQEKIARHNTRLGQRSESLSVADDLDDRLKGFVYIGVALGGLDTRR